MEFGRGKTLNEFISRKGLDLDQALKYAVQIAEALATAQASGIIHRDVKPATIMITDSGLVKVLDFGLAKLTELPVELPISESDATRTIDEILRTTEGTIVGTAAYMSPEQAKGKQVDSRTDVFSFGAVLYEMVTGQRPFRGSSQLSILTSVLRDDPQPIAAVAGNVPPELERIIARCLRKDPDRRWHSMKDVQVALTELREEADSSTRITIRPGIVSSAGTKGPASEAGEKWTGKSVTPVGKPLLKEALIAAGVLLAVAAGVIVWHGPVDKGAAIPAAVPSPRIVTPPSNKPPPLGEALLTNDGIVELVKGGVPENLIIGQVRSSKTNFDLSPPQLVRLVNERVPNNVIEAMRNPQLTPNGSSLATGLTSVTIPEGQRILLKLRQTVSASTARKDDPIDFIVAAPVRVAGKVVIERGAPASGVVAGIEKMKFKLFGGKLVLQLGWVHAVDGQPVRLRANDTAEHRTNQIVIQKVNPDSGEPGAKQKEVMAIAGTPFTAYADTDRVIAVREQPKAPI